MPVTKLWRVLTRAVIQTAHIKPKPPCSLPTDQLNLLLPFYNSDLLPALPFLIENTVYQILWLLCCRWASYPLSFSSTKENAEVRAALERSGSWTELISCTSIGKIQKGPVRKGKPKGDLKGERRVDRRAWQGVRTEGTAQGWEKGQCTATHEKWYEVLMTEPHNTLGKWQWI